jgi:hypothetical protein
MIGEIVHLRQHCHLGPAQIARYLRRHHDGAISNPGVWRILNASS